MNRAIDEVEIVNEHIKIEWIDHRRVVILHVDSIKHEILDLWFEKTTAIMQAWEPGRTYYSLQDFTQTESFVVTPHLRQRSRELTLVRRDMNSITAICVPKSVMAHVTQLFIKALPNTRNSTRMREMFFSVEEGLAWLEKQMAEEGKTK